MNHSTSSAGRGVAALLFSLLAACSAEAPSPCEVRGEAVCEALRECGVLLESTEQFLSYCNSYEAKWCPVGTSDESAGSCSDDIKLNSCELTNAGIYPETCNRQVLFSARPL